MDLINRKAARTAVYGYEMQTGIAEMPLEFAHNKIDKVPSVPAVPLDKLCEWLSGYAEPPLDALTMCDNEFEAWKLTLTKVMEEESWR